MVPDPRLNPNDENKKSYHRDFRNSIPNMPTVDKAGALAWVSEIARLAKLDEEAEEAEPEIETEEEDQGRAMIFEDVA
ncbi:hypothetical protein GCM10025867_47770 (plasmid) [Frondihabitans sucicola]|uniref:Uncharacterized protein n=2 Tax=Frondihabitans sucicola TaxID=1268041 RepID=A0ABN6Y681_9MICO|nr:hypothetical protein [Frondihabitans sucicola]BDZ52536.1 hypothetical protein GCM10025867_47770 [Frondihabitans sucicola]